jgi:L-lactate dehydrogenase complex protein LldG
MASLLPPLHIAIVRESQLIPRLEDWVATQYADGLRTLRAASNITLITGCSRTADIEMSPVFGVHGPLEFVVVLIPV